MNLSDRPTELVNLLDVLRALRLRLRLVAVCALIGALLGLLLAFTLPRSYEATAVIRVGQVARTDGEAVQSNLIELPAQAADRMRMTAFVRESGLANPDEPVESLAKRISVRVLKGSDFLEVRYPARSPAEATRALRVLVELLRKRHEEMAAPARQRLVDQLRVVQQLRSESQGRRAEVLQSLRGGTTLGPIKNEYPFLQLAFVGADNQLARWEMLCKTAMEAPAAFPTALVEEILPPTEPVGPRRALLVVAGLLAGMLLAVGLVLSRLFTRRAMQ